MKKAMMVIVAAMMVGSGCASYLGTRMTASERAAVPDGVVAVNLADPSYWTAWGEHPWLMAGATAVDLGVGYFAFAAIKEAIDDSGDKAAQSQAIPTMQVDNDGGTQIIIINGGTATASQTWTGME